MENEIPLVFDGSGLYKMFDLQTQFLNELYSQGKFPGFPVSLDTRNGQAHLREYLGYTIQELSEFFSDYQDLMILHSNNPELNPNINHDSLTKLINLNEELADVHSFMLDLMILVGIEADDINEYYKNLLKASDKQIIASKDITEMSLSYARMINVVERNYPARGYYIDLALKLRLRNDDFTTKAGRKLSPDTLVVVSRICWEMTHYLNSAIGQLKLKPWKTMAPPVNVGDFKTALMEGWLYWFLLLDLLGWDHYEVWENYYTKNQKNWKRLKEGY